MQLPGGEDEYQEGGQQLTLADDEDALPWLESDEDYEEAGSDYRILIFAALAVAALAAILFGVNHFMGSNGASSGDVVADGSTIEAPDEPYKTRPDDPGGTEVAGTGDVSFEVGQGQASEGQLADGAPAPSINLDQPETGTSEAETPAANTSGGVSVQVGAFQTRASAEAGWNTLRSRFSMLDGLNHRIVEGAVDSGTIYRLQVVTSNVSAADTLCRNLRNAGGDCQVKR